MKQTLIIFGAMSLVIFFSGITFAISNFSFDRTPLSEPAVLLFLGIGLISVSSIGRKKLPK